MDSQERGRESFLNLRNQRIAARNALSPTLRESYDEHLSQILRTTLENIGYSWRGSNEPIPMRRIVRLLNKGAIASCLNPNELRGPNLGDLVDALEEPPSNVRHHRIFALLDHIIASPCDSWATNRRYSGNGGTPLPYFLISAIVTGDLWGCNYRRQDMYFRFRAWCTVRKMVWAYRDDAVTERLQAPRTGFIALLISDFLSSVSNMEGRYKFTNVEHGLFDAMVAFFKRRSNEIFAQAMPDWWEYRCEAWTPFAIELLIRINSQFFHKYYRGYAVQRVFDSFCSSKRSRRKVLRLLSYAEFRKWILCEKSVRELCRRKERVIFEELYKRDADRLMVMIPFALSVLESKDVRGCKHRLIEFLRGVLLKNGGNEKEENTNEHAYACYGN